MTWSYRTSRHAQSLCSMGHAEQHTDNCGEQQRGVREYANAACTHACPHAHACVNKLNSHEGQACAQITHLVNLDGRPVVEPGMHCACSAAVEVQDPFLQPPYIPMHVCAKQLLKVMPGKQILTAPLGASRALFKPRPCTLARCLSTSITSRTICSTDERSRLMLFFGNHVHDY